MIHDGMKAKRMKYNQFDPENYYQIDLEKRNAKFL